MAAQTGSFSTYAAVGIREDLTDAIYNISPTTTPFISSIGKTNATQTYHEWQTDSLAAVDTSNAQVEGFVSPDSTSSPTTRIGNYCQISSKDIVVSGSLEKAIKAGRKSSIAYLMAKRGKELRNDMEAILTGPQGQNAGGSATARTVRALESWLTTNASRGTGGANATGPTASPTDATAGSVRTFTETMLKNVIQQVYTQGGEPSILMTGPYNKQVVSGTFTGRSQAREMIDKERIQGAASLYASDFGDLKVVPNRFQRPRTAFVLDPAYAAVAYFRPFMTENLAKTGDSTRKMLLTEYSLEMRQEAAHGVIADLTTS